MTAKIKVMYVIGTMEVGGAERHLVEVLKRLDRNKFEPFLCCLSRGGSLMAEVEKAGVPYAIAGFDGLTRYSFISLYRLYRIIRREKPDILHCYLFWAYVIGGYLGRLAGVPYLIAARRSLGYFKEGKPHYQFLENTINRWTDIIMVNSRGVWEDVLKREKNVDPARLRLIYNGVDLTRFDFSFDPEAKKRELGIEPGWKVVGTVANLYPYKGHRELILAAAGVVKKFPRTVFLLVGRDAGMRAELEKLATQLGITANVRFLGERADVPELLKIFDIQVLPSYEEGFSNAILEGMASGNPMVVTDVGGNAEAVVDGECGFVVPPRDPKALEEAIATLLTDEGLALRMGEAARRRVEKHFRVEDMVRKIEAMYLELMEEKKGEKACSEGRVEGLRL